MSLEELREQNKRLTVEKGLELFIKNGVEQTTVRDVATAAGLTERSVYRYFSSKADLVLATAFLFWERIAKRVEERVNEKGYQGMTGIEQVDIMLRFYANLYLDNPDSVRFILSCETALYNAGVTTGIQSRPPGRFEDSDSPMVRAIRAGLADGSVSSDVDVKEIYYNSYDAILGTMQRQAMGSTACDLDDGQRMEHLCDLFIAAYQGKI
jgi:AcrR family transcriptional regulator